MMQVIKKLRGVSCTGNRQPIPGDRAPAVTMTGLHVSLHWPVGYGPRSLQASAVPTFLKWCQHLRDQ